MLLPPHKSYKATRTNLALGFLHVYVYPYYTLPYLCTPSVLPETIPWMIVLLLVPQGMCCNVTLAGFIIGLLDQTKGHGLDFVRL